MTSVSTKPAGPQIIDMFEDLEYQQPLQTNGASSKRLLQGIGHPKRTDLLKPNRVNSQTQNREKMTANINNQPVIPLQLSKVQPITNLQPVNTLLNHQQPVTTSVTTQQPITAQISCHCEQPILVQLKGQQPMNAEPPDHQPIISQCVSPAQKKALQLSQSGYFPSASLSLIADKVSVTF